MLKDYISSGKYNHICIATGYWDLPGMQLIHEELKSFLENGGRLDIMIGQEPQLRSYQTNTEQEENSFPDFYLQRDINQLSDLYRSTAELILMYCNVNKYDGLGISVDDTKNEDREESQIQVRLYGQKDIEHKQFLHAKCYIFLGQAKLTES